MAVDQRLYISRRRLTFSRQHLFESEFYRLRWQIELFWKFLKMHLKLDRLITKNVNGIEIQIYACLIAYVILQLTKIPQGFGNKALDELGYLQAFMCENISGNMVLPFIG
ncbi:transposase [Trichothermofontia sp.]